MNGVPYRDDYLDSTSNPSFDKNCYILKTDGTVTVDWSNLGVASLTVGNGMGGSSGTADINRGGGLVVLTALEVKEGAAVVVGGAVTVSGRNNVPGHLTVDGGMFNARNTTTVSSELNVNSGSYNASGATTVNGGGALNVGETGQDDGVLNAKQLGIVTVGTLALSSGTINLGAGGIVSWDDDYTINLSGGTFGAPDADWQTDLNATVKNGKTVSFAPTESRTIKWNGVLSGACGVDISGKGNVTLAGINSYTGTTTVNADAALNLTGKVGGDLLVAENGAFTGSGTVAGDLTIKGTMKVDLDDLQNADALEVGGTVSVDGAIEFTAADPMDYLDEKIVFMTSDDTPETVSKKYRFPDIDEEYVWISGKDEDGFWVGIVNNLDVPITPPQGVTATYGQTFADVVLTNPEGNPDGSWAWAEDTSTSVGGVGDHIFKADFTPTDADSHNPVNDVEVTVTVNKAVPTVTAPTARTLSYNNLAQELVEGGYTEDGTLYYALGDETEATEVYGTSVPTGTEVGNYYVWYKVAGDDNHSDTEPACIPVEITRPHTPSTPATETVTIPVTGDEARTEVTISVSGGGTATITSADIDDVLSEDKKTGTVTIDVSSLRESITEVVLPAEMVNKLADAVADPKDDADGVEIKLPAGTVTFDKAAVAAIAKQADGKDLHLNLEGIPQSRLDAGQQAAIRDMTVCKVLDVYMTANSKRISDFQGGTATVEVGFALQDGQKAKGIVVWYVDETGEKTEIANSYDGKAVCFAVTHFSNYVIAYDEARAALPDGDYEALTDEEKAQADAIAAAHNTDKETAAQMLKYAKEHGIPLDTVLLGDAAIKGLPTSDEDPAGSSFGKLTARATKRAKTAITVTWKQLDDADGYLIYGNLCNKSNKPLKTITQKDTTKWTQKKLKKRKFYKYMVVAYKNFGDVKMPIAASVYVHTATKGVKKTVAKKVKVNKTSVALGVGETVKLKASEVKAERKKLSKHRGIKYETLNDTVATVDGTGLITAVGEGTTTIYAYAQNGLYRIVTVTVTAAPVIVPNGAEEGEEPLAEHPEDALAIELAEPETEAIVEIDDGTVEDNDTAQIETEIILEDDATYME